jgi:hypothetical protein
MLKMGMYLFSLQGLSARVNSTQERNRDFILLLGQDSF